ncbi:hypothetical protein D3C80_1340980 [compost metagenome]
MAELVQDDVINALAGRFDEVRVKRDPAMGGTTPPLGLHSQDTQRRTTRDPDGLIQHGVEPSGKHLFGAGLVPVCQQLTDFLGATLSNRYLQFAAQQLYPLHCIRCLYHLEQVLFAKVIVALTADVLARGDVFQLLTKIAQLLVDPASAFPDRCEHRIITSLKRRRDYDAAIGMYLDQHLAASLSPLPPLEGDQLIAVAKAKGWS